HALSTYALSLFSFFFFDGTASSEIYTLSLHDALPILLGASVSKLRSRRLSAMGKECLESVVLRKRRRRLAYSPCSRIRRAMRLRSEEHTSELQSQSNLVCRLLLEKKKEIYSSSLPTTN